jgi:TonB-dependent receptor
MRKPVFTRTPLAAGVALALGAPTIQPVLAQEPVMEEVIVTGIRGSLQQSMDLKRGASGVVDAISAEDIGNFPDTNLAESLQRITGVSIDRERGEGARVTVRGFGPGFNLVLLNGRQMPTTSGVNRDFDFSNLASEGISAVEVWKSGQADVPSGGIGSTINVRTTRPLDNPGITATFAASGMYDESNDHALSSSSVKPEISGLFSGTFWDDRIGIAISAIYQDREGGSATASATNWRSFTGNTSCWGCGGEVEDWGGIPTAADPNQVNRPGDDQIYSVPQVLGYRLSTFERTRTNGQLTFQIRPIETLTATLDYVYAEQEVKEQWNDFSAWFNFGGQSTEYFDGPVATPAMYSEDNGGGGDFAMGAAQQGFINTNDSIGLNLLWDISDNFSLEFDYHSSSAENEAADPLFGSSNVLSIAAFSRQTTTGYFGNDFPVLDLELSNPLSPDDMIVTGSVFTNDYSKMDIDQAKLGGTFFFDAGFVESIDFGVQLTDLENRVAQSVVQRDAWGGVTQPGAIADLMTPANIGSSFDQIPGSGDARQQMDFYTFDIQEVANRTNELIASGDAQLFVPGDGNLGPCGTALCADPNLGLGRTTREETQAVYAQVKGAFELGVPINWRLGLRYEETDVTSEAASLNYTGLVWVAGNELALQSDGEVSGSLTGSYDYFLPNFDISFDITDTFVVRGSVSRTLTRANFQQLEGGIVLDSPVRVGSGGTGRIGSPGLLPYVSDNLDLSAEWYYGETSYLSVGYFRKDVDNFIGQGVESQVFDNVPNPELGPLGDEARAALGPSATGGDLYCWLLTNRADDPSVTPGSPEACTGGQIASVAGRDPGTPFDLFTNVNQDSTSADGWELNIQHNFGESGFGGIVNATFVDADVGYDTLTLQEQFILTGLSDSANLIAFYDKNGLSVRLAYNWRDAFIAGNGQANTGPSEPTFNDEYEQWDLAVNYWLTDNIQLFGDVINLTDETQYVFGREQRQVLFATQLGRRYNIGMRYRF